MRPKIVVVGSSNTDLVMKLPRLPKPGETIIGGTFSMAAGGKGANQAIAAARAGGDVTFVTKVGNDHFGREAIRAFAVDGVETIFVGTDPSAPSGIALIFVDDLGENSIGVASGANNALLPSDLEKAALTISTTDVLLVQLEIPLPTVEAAVRMAADAGVRVILNPAPAQHLDPDLCRRISVLTPNELEAEHLTGIRCSDDSAIERATGTLKAKGIAGVVITLGARGSYFDGGSTRGFVPAPTVTPVDTTAAGDIFSAALAVSLGEGSSLHDAVRFASAAASLSVTKLGAQPSAPHRTEILSFLEHTS